MHTETKSRLLIPGPHEDPEIARDRHFRGNWPPEVNGDLPGYNPSEDAESENKSHKKKVEATRRRERHGVVKRVGGYLGALVAAGLIGLGVTEIAHLMGNEEHSPWDHKNTPAHIKHH